MSEKKTWFNLNLSRGPFTGDLKASVGLVVTVKADPLIEEIMKGHAKEQKKPVEYYGQHWFNLNTDHKLEAYNIPKLSNSSTRYTIEAVGSPLLIVPELDDSGRPLTATALGRNRTLPPVNLSFFRLVGISSGEGISFGVSGAYSMEYINNLKRDLLVEARQFLYDYVIPLEINLAIVSK